MSNTENLVEYYNDHIIYNGMKFKLTTRNVDIKKEFQNSNLYKIYSCINRRKDEPYRKGKGYFCSSQVLLKLKNNGDNELINRQFTLLEKHSPDCIKLSLKHKENLKEYFNYKQTFLNEVYNYLESILIFNKKFIKIEIMKIYKNYESYFELDNKEINTIINNFKRDSIKFTKNFIFINNKDNKGNNLLQSYNYFLIYNEKKQKPIICEYAIWSNNIMIAHIREAECLFIDGTWYKPPGFCQIIVIMFKDIITKEKYPGMFIVSNNKLQEIYEKIFNNVYNILTQNSKYAIKTKYIITDMENALVNAINLIFPKCIHIGCYFHYKYDILLNLRNNHLYNKENKIESDNLINDLGLIPLMYKGKMDLFNSLIDKIIKKYEKYADFINEYFMKYKKLYFHNGIYNYELIPVDCRSNSFLENYNHYLKDNLGKKNSLIWLNFITFIKNEFAIKEEAIIKNCNTNVAYKSKYTKFNENKYLDKTNISIKSLNNDISISLNSTNEFLTKFPWIIYNNNSCRYDSFITLFIFCLYGKLKTFYFDELNFHIQFLINKCTDIINLKFEIIDDIWQYFIINQINVLKTEKINNENITIDDGFHKFGFVNQLFNIFNNSKIFCIEYSKSILCDVCKFNLPALKYYHNCMVCITEDLLNLKKLENVFLVVIPENKKEKCPICKLNISTLDVKYEITSYPEYIILIFDLHSYNILVSKKKQLLILIRERLNINIALSYELMGGITMASYNHFSSFIKKFDFVEGLSYKFDKANVYYHDGMKNSGYFLKYENINELFKKNKKLVPYIILYRKL